MVFVLPLAWKDADGLPVTQEAALHYHWNDGGKGCNCLTHLVVTQQGLISGKTRDGRHITGAVPTEYYREDVSGANWDILGREERLTVDIRRTIRGYLQALCDGSVSVIGR